MGLESAGLADDHGRLHVKHKSDSANSTAPQQLTL